MIALIANFASMIGFKPKEAERVLSILNTAEDAQQLADVIEIPGQRDVGISVASSILDRRDQLGGFKSLSELAKVPQVGPVRFSQIITSLRKSSQQGGRIVMEELRKNKEPRAVVEKERAMQHASLNIRRAWAGGIPDFEDWGTVELDPELEKEFPQKRATIVEITTKDGKVFSHKVDIAKGDPENPFSKSELEDKFNLLSSKVVNEERRRKIIDYVDGLETKENITDFFPLLKATSKP